MNKSDDIKFSEIMAAMSELYEMSISDVVMEIWFKTLEEFPIDVISQAVFSYMKNPDTGRYKPKPADIVKMIKGTASDAASLGWTKVDKAVRMVGSYESVVFDDNIIHKVITDMGGWIGFGDVKESEWPFVAKDFQNRYRIYCGQGEIEAPNKLIGSHEDYNFKQGLEVKSPVLIGDKEKATLVLSGSSSKPLRISHDK
ncbi:MAG: hypothetical protein KAR40_14020 [Candidatus Sabulitectum sp.]|nr:hypothetical protein [Candidatus Sabulitectum sp.]